MKGVEQWDKAGKRYPHPPNCQALVEPLVGTHHVSVHEHSIDADCILPTVSSEIPLP